VTTPPALPPPLPSRFPWLDRLSGLLAWGFAVSVVLHLAFGPLLGAYKPAAGTPEEVQKVSLSHKIKVVVPTPPPPTPTPPPLKSTPPPRSATAAPQPKALKLNVVHLKSSSNSGPSEHTYVAPKSGAENGVPAGSQAANAPAAPAAPAPAAATAAPTQTPSPKPACEAPHVDATVVKVAEAEYPETARQSGAVGSVDVEVSLTATGAVTGTSIYKSSGNAALDAAGVRAAQDSTYKPELLDCKPSPGTYLFHADFTM
jgi:protein TonB